jgi:hypothetical protein
MTGKLLALCEEGPAFRFQHHSRNPATAAPTSGALLIPSVRDSEDNSANSFDGNLRPLRDWLAPLGMV